MRKCHDNPLLDYKQLRALPLKHQVGARIRAARQRRGLTLLQVAKECETSPQTIQRLETANMTLSMEWLELISRVLSIAPGDLFDSRFDDHNETIVVMREAARAAMAQLDSFMERAAAYKAAMEKFLEETK
jgi:transcriptional regulator with XRE-family HTH domain